MAIDVVIAGGGVMGCSLAYSLKQADPGISVTVVERDPTYRCASSALSASSIRQQFSTPVNIAMSRYGMDFLKSAGELLSTGDERSEIPIHERGYLYLADAGQEEVLRENHAVQRRCGVAVELLEPPQLARQFPWLNTEDLALASLGIAGEGWFDGYLLLQAFRKKAKNLGVVFIEDEVIGFTQAGRRMTHVHLRNGASLAAGAVVNAAGPHAGRLARLADIPVPVVPEKHCIFVFDCKEAPEGCPLVIDPSGVYFRPEGRLFIAGPPVPENRDPNDLSLEVDHALFDDVVWPVLASRVPAFETIKPTNAWAGHYEVNTFDHNAILGLTDRLDNFYLINGFSGHGMQHAAAAGRGLAELILHGAFRSIDLSELSYTRLLENRRVQERNVI